MDIYNITVKKTQTEEVSMGDYRGKVLLIVNTATGCGFTPQYDGLQKLYEKYNAQGFEILDFPCNQFANQAPGSDSEINNFCTINFGTTFPRFSKIDVNGQNESPLYRFLKKAKGGMLGSNIKWNFTKFLVDKNGNVVRRYGPTEKPEKLERDIQLLLKQLQIYLIYVKGSEPMNDDILKLKNQLCFPLYACSREVVKKYKPFLDEIGLTYTQYIVMMVLWEHKSINVKSLGEQLYLDSGTLTPLLKKMEAQGLVIRTRDVKDERSVIITITEQGEQLKNKAYEIPLKISNCISISPEEGQLLYQLLYKVLGQISSKNE